METETLKTIDALFDMRYKQLCNLMTKHEEGFVRDAAAKQLNKLTCEWNDFKTLHKVL
jgi:hypothetical protein